MLWSNIIIYIRPEAETFSLSLFSTHRDTNMKGNKSKNMLGVSLGSFRDAVSLNSEGNDSASEAEDTEVPAYIVMKDLGKFQEENTEN